MQRKDFSEIFRIMAGLPVTIRLLDPPLHEFLPHTDEDMAEVAKAVRRVGETLRARAEELHESNPMLGHRGCRLGDVSGNLRDAGPRHLRGGSRCGEGNGRSPRAGDHDPACGDAPRA
jgi:hypothetical protein